MFLVKSVCELERQQNMTGIWGEFAYVSSPVPATTRVAKAYLRTEVYFWCKQQIFRDCPYVCVGGGRMGVRSVWQCLLKTVQCPDFREFLSNVWLVGCL